ncbi:glycosyltransferase [Mesorhizobium sp. RMAD-H1]|uniref:glycosyltransferase n=1 Tax=Mesorhizobium sp. RMAD-H1 TaxID=2587065 RepID=UPI0016143FC0|nr:glycosyltransferase [Mesorhizobium sp. RMAD-H1]MBB2971421.1 GT2 family glycosyltransferase [Mesorhizobium sp. RMAD-H1]
MSVETQTYSDRKSAEDRPARRMLAALKRYARNSRLVEFWRQFNAELRKLKLVYQRILIETRRNSRPGFDLQDGNGETVGRLEKIEVERGMVHLRGWTTKPVLRLHSGPIRRSIVPDQTRHDVNEVLGLRIDARTGFDINFPFRDDDLRIGFEGTDGPREYVFTAMTRMDRAYSNGSIFFYLAWVGIRNIPLLFRYFVLRDPLAASRLKDLYFTFERKPEVDLTAGILAGNPAQLAVDEEVFIILPVYNGFELLPEVLDRVERFTGGPFRLVIVEDCSTDARVRPWLRSWAAGRRSSVILIENEHNLGFIQAVNRGLAAAAGHHVVLLNSDAFVPEGWLPRLMAPIITDELVASATPMSNDAEIFSVPVMCRKAELRPGQVDHIDAVARNIDAAVLSVDAPTGVGFCMAMNKKFLGEIPTFDLTFGKGYGEEVDWCQKTRALGGRHVAVPNLFVEHRGGSSFGLEAKTRLVRSNGAIISRRYPDYDGDVQNFIATDPLLSARVLLAIAAVQRPDRPLPVYFAHDMGGGAEAYLQNRIKSEIETFDQGAVTIRERTGAGLYELEVHSAAGRTRVHTDDLGNLRNLLHTAGQLHLFYSCIVGSREPLKLATFMRELCRPGDRLSILIHDYFPLCPSYTLLDSNGKYCGVPSMEACANCLRTGNPNSAVANADIHEWRKVWGGVMTAADHVEVFSESSRRIVSKAYPAVAAKIVVRPHRLRALPQRLTPPNTRTLTIGTLGNIGYQKGARALRDLAVVLPKDRSIRISVIGNFDYRFHHSAINVYGQYQLEDLAGIAAQQQIGCWLMPSIWPETFSYSIHEMLATGLPVFSFSLGAQAGAVTKSGNGHILKAAPDQPHEVLNEILAVMRQISKSAA